MKKLYFSLLFCSLYLYSFAQTDWEIFPEGQRTWWENERQELVLFYNDSTEIWSNSDIHFFGQKHLRAPYESCAESIESFIIEYNLFGFEGIFQLFYELETDSSAWFYRKNTSFDVPFYPATEVGEQWTFATDLMGVDSFTIACVSKDSTSFLTYSDSVKTFSIQASADGNSIAHPLNDLTFRLSKTAGFIEYVPLHWFIETNQGTAAAYNTHKIKGFEKDTLYGYTNQFEDYFHNFQVGDIHIWHRRADGPWGGKDYLRIDSITNITLTPNTVELAVFRTLIIPIDNVIDTVYSDEVIIYEKAKYQNYLQSGTNWLYPAIDEIWGAWQGETKTLLRHQPIFKDNVILNRMYPPDNDLHVLFLDNCSLSGLIDYGHSETIQSELGLVRTYTGGWGYTIDTMICHKRNDILYGENCYPEIVTSTLEQKVELTPFKVAPNPFSNMIQLELSDQFDLQKTTYRIYHINGQLLQTGSLPTKDAKLKLELLPSGMYLLEVADEKQQKVQRIIKN